MYKVPGGLDRVKLNFKVINLTKPLEEIMRFGDRWRGLGYEPVVHIPGRDIPGWDKPWKSPVDDPSGLIDNVPVHINLLVFDPYNEEQPSEVIPSWEDCGGGKWTLWERKRDVVYFNGTQTQFEQFFAHELRDAEEPASTEPPEVFQVDEYKLVGTFGDKEVNLTLQLTRSMIIN